MNLASGNIISQDGNNIMLNLNSKS